MTAEDAPFRREDAHGMLEAFRDLRDQNGRGTPAFWLFVVADTLRAASTERVLALPRVSAVDFYHPYLERTAFVPWGYGATLGAGLAVVQAGSWGAVCRPRGGS